MQIFKEAATLKEMAGDPEGGDGQVIRGQWAEGLTIIHDQALLPPTRSQADPDLGAEGLRSMPRACARPL